MSSTITPPHTPFDPSSTHSTPSPRSSCLEIAHHIDHDDGVSVSVNEQETTLQCEEGTQTERMTQHPQEQLQCEEGQTELMMQQLPDYCESQSLDEGSIVASSPDYDYLVATEEEEEEEEISFSTSSPDYDYLAAAASDGNDANVHSVNNNSSSEELLQNGHNGKIQNNLLSSGEKDYEYVLCSDAGEEYILGTLMVRVLQARNVKLDHRIDSGGLSSLLSNHRRTRHKKYTQSPLSGGGSTPNSSNTTLYSKLTFHSQQQYTENAVPGMNGDYYWSRGDQSYFDVVCPSYSRVTFGKKKVEKKLDDEEEKKKMEEKEHENDHGDAVCCKPSIKVKEDDREEVQKPKTNMTSTPPLLNLSLFAKKLVGKGGKQQLMSSRPTKKGSEFNDDDGESQFVGEVSINITRVLTGKTPYFDEWCTLHNDNIAGLQDLEDGAGRVRVVIEYEPTDSPPRSGDVCIFANIYPAMEKELYPVPLYSIRTNRPIFHRSGSITSFDKTTPASSSTTLSSAGSSSLSSNKSMTSISHNLVRQPKQFHVEESVGDHVVLSYTTPENWAVSFEIHRYNLLVTHRYCGTVEKVRESVLDFCDNISQSPMAGVILKTAETIPDEGLVHVGAEVVGAAGAVLGRWMEVGLEGLINDVVDVANLDGRYSHLSEDEDDEEEQQQEQGGEGEVSSDSPLKAAVAKKDLEEPSEEKEALPGMPDCPITGQPMIDPVVAADGHTYERYAIARWFQTSNRSPLTGAIMTHANLVPNYLLLSSLGGDAKK